MLSGPENMSTRYNLHTRTSAEFDTSFTGQIAIIASPTNFRTSAKQGTERQRLRPEEKKLKQHNHGLFAYLQNRHTSAVALDGLRHSSEQLRGPCKRLGVHRGGLRCSVYGRKKMYAGTSDGDGLTMEMVSF